VKISVLTEVSQNALVALLIPSPMHNPQTHIAVLVINGHTAPSWGLSLPYTSLKGVEGAQARCPLPRAQCKESPGCLTGPRHQGSDEMQARPTESHKPPALHKSF